MMTPPSGSRVGRTTRTTVKTYAECGDAQLEAFAQTMRVSPHVVAASLSPGYGYLLVVHDESVDIAAIAKLAEDVGYVVESETDASGWTDIGRVGPALSVTALALALGVVASMTFSKPAHAGATVAAVPTSRTSAFTYARALGDER